MNVLRVLASVALASVAPGAVLSASAARAQIIDVAPVPADAVPPSSPEVRPVVSAPRAVRPAGVDPFAGQTEDEALAALRVVEEKLSLGRPVERAERDQLALAVLGSPSPRVRALAAAMLPWLDPTQSAAPLTRALGDDDPRVKSQAAQSLVALSRRLDDDQRRRAITAGLALLDDASDEVACAGGELASSLAPSVATDAIRARAAQASSVRYACWSRFAGLPLRRVKVPPIPASPPGTAPPQDEEPPTPALAPATAGGSQTGELLFVTTAASAGLLAGGLIPGIFFPARDTLTYTLVQTKYGREEPSVFFMGGVGALGAMALGGGAWGLSLALGPPDVAGASAVAVSTASGALGGVGLGLMIGLDQGVASASISAATVAGFGAGTAIAYGLHPDGTDVGVGATVGGLSLLAGSLAAFTALPAGLQELGNGVKRTDFGIGVGLLSGGTLGLAGLALAPLVDVSPGRLMATSAGALLGASLGVGGGFIFTPRSLNIRSRIACGVGLGGELIGGSLAFFLIPEELAKAFASVDLPRGGELVAIDDGRLKIGVPMVIALPPLASAPDVPVLGMPIFGSRF